MSSSLLMTRRFAPLFWTQFFSAFSDNFLKNALVFLILFHIGGTDAEALITLAAAVFIAPYFFLSALGGELADRYDKAVVARRLKFCEIGIAFIAVVGFGLHSVVLLFIALFLFGVIAALFGPIKYGILPDHLARSELPAGNALVEGATFIAILLGTIVGGIAAKDGGDPAHFAFLMIVFSLLCWGASLFIPRTGQAAPDLKVQANVLRSTIGLLNFLREDWRLWWGALVTSWFWLVGAVSLSLMPPLVKNVLGGNEEVVTTCLAIFSISIAIGSGLAAWLAAGRIILPRPRRVHARCALYSRPWWLFRRLHQRTRHPISARSRGARHRGRTVHRADVCGGAGLGRRRPPRARGGGSQCPQRRVHGGKYGDGGRAADGRNDDITAFPLARRGKPRGGDRCRPHHARERAQRCALDHLSRAVPDGSQRHRQPQQARVQSNHRAQSRKLPRCGTRVVAAQ